MPAFALALPLVLAAPTLLPTAARAPQEPSAEAPPQGSETPGGGEEPVPDEAGEPAPQDQDAGEQPAEPTEVPPEVVPPGPQPPPQDPAEDEAARREARQVELPEGVSREDVFGTGRRLELSLDAAMRVALGNDIGLQIEEATTDVALYDARGSWGAFDFVFSANAGIVDTEVQQRTELEGAEVLTVDTQQGGMGLSRPTELGGLFSLTYDRNNTQTNNVFAVINPSTTDIVRLSYTQPLLRGFGVDYATSLQEQSEVQYELQRERLRLTRQELLLSVSNAYWDLVLALQQLDVVNSGLDLALEQLERDRRVFEAGLGTEVDVLQSEAQVATRIELLLQADVDAKAAEDGLKQLLFPGTDEDTWETRLVPATPLPEEVAAAALPSWTATLLTALDYRSEVRQRALEIEVAEINLERAVSERRPQLDLGLTASSQGFSGEPSEAFTSAWSYDFPTYTASLSFSSPIQNRTARANVHAARAQVRRARLGYDQTESLIVADVREALRQLAYQAEAVRAADRSLEATRRQLEAEQARNREGISTTFEVLQLQDQFVQAMNSERSARVAYMKARVALRAAVGTLGETLE